MTSMSNKYYCQLVGLVYDLNLWAVVSSFMSKKILCSNSLLILKSLAVYVNINCIMLCVK